MLAWKRCMEYRHITIEAQEKCYGYNNLTTNPAILNPTVYSSLEPVVLLKNLFSSVNIISEICYICEMYFSSNF